MQVTSLIMEGTWFIQNQKNPLLTGGYRRSRSRIERMIRKDPRADYYLVLAQLEIKKQHWDRAQAALEMALQIEPSHTEAQLLLAQVLEAKQDLDSAHTAYKVVLEGRPHFSRACREYARYLTAHTEELQLARSLLLHSLELDPRDALAHTILAEVYLLQGRTEQATLHLQLAGHFHEGQTSYHQQAAKLLANMQKYDEAAEQLRMALRVDPRNKIIRTQFKEVKKATHRH